MVPPACCDVCTQETIDFDLPEAQVRGFIERFINRAGLSVQELTDPENVQVRPTASQSSQSGWWAGLMVVAVCATVPRVVALYVCGHDSAWPTGCW